MKAASLPDLLRWVAVDQEHDAQCSRIFLFSYRNFTRPSRLWAELLKLSRSLSTSNKSPIFNFINLWLFCCYETDFARNRRLRSQVLDFVASTFSVREANYLKLLALRCAARAARTASASLNVVLFQSRPPTGVAPVSFSFFRAWKTDAIAQALLSLSADLARTVHITEFSRHAWQSPRRAALAPAVTALSEYFNRISFWSATEILREEDVATQAKRLKKAIKVMHRCIELNDMQSAAALCAGLNLHSLQRLKQPWLALAPAVRRLFDEADQLYSPLKNWADYRALMKAQLRAGATLVPYMAPLLKDLTFIEDGNADHGAGAPELINWEKMEMLGRAVEVFCVAQAGLHVMPRTSALSEITAALQWVQPLGEENLEALSFRHEAPRNAQLELPAATIEEVLRRDPLTWTSAEVALFVSHHTSNNFYAENFMIADIAGQDLPELTMDKMVELGVHKLGHRKLLLKKIAALLGSDGSPVSSRSGSAIHASVSASSSSSASAPLQASSSAEGRLAPLSAQLQSSSSFERARGGVAATSGRHSPPLRDARKDPAAWTCDDVQRWLAAANEQELSSQLSGINGVELISLDDPALEVLGVPTIGQRKRLARKIRDLVTQRGVAVMS